MSGKTKNARQGIETAKPAARPLSFWSCGKTKNARQGIETLDEPNYAGDSTGTSGGKTKNARRGIETLVTPKDAPTVSGLWKNKECPSGH